MAIVCSNIRLQFFSTVKDIAPHNQAIVVTGQYNVTSLPIHDIEIVLVMIVDDTV